MPRCSSAAFDENGFAEVIRDVEELFMLQTDGTNDMNSGDSDSGTSPDVNNNTSDGTTPAAASPGSGGSSTSSSSGGGGGVAGTLAYVRATQSSTQGVLANSIAVATNYTAPSGSLTSSWNVSTGTFTAPTAGLYLFSAGTYLEPAFAIPDHFAGIGWAGGNLGVSVLPYITASGLMDPGVLSTFPYAMSAGQTLVLNFINAHVGGGMNFLGGTLLITRLGDV